MLRCNEEWNEREVCELNFRPSKVPSTLCKNEHNYDKADNLFPSHRKWIFSALAIQHSFKVEELEDQFVNCLASS